MVCNIRTQMRLFFLPTLQILKDGQQTSCYRIVLPFTALESTTVSGEIIGVNQVASCLSCCKCNKKVDPSPEHPFIEFAKRHFKQKQTASKAHWFAQVLFQYTNDDKIDLTLFEEAIHQIAKLTSDTAEVKGLTQADIEFIVYFATNLYNLQSMKQNS